MIGESRMKSFLVFLLGVVVGALALGVVGYLMAPGMMLEEHRSPYGLDDTVKRLEAAAKADGWVVSSIQKLDESVKKHGGPKVAPVRLVNLCQAQHAGKILSEDDARFVSVMMPCTIAVYEKSDGSVWVASMNPGLMGKVFGGVISEVMAGPVAEAQQRFLETVR
jgi:uncharacterized protein (DUF302 family)